MRDWKAQNRERVKGYARDFYARNLEKARADRQDYYRPPKNELDRMLEHHRQFDERLDEPVRMLQWEIGYRELLDALGCHQALAALTRLARRYGHDKLLGPEPLCLHCSSVLTYYDERFGYYCSNCGVEEAVA